MRDNQKHKRHYLLSAIVYSLILSTVLLSFIPYVHSGLYDIQWYTPCENVDEFTTSGFFDITWSVDGVNKVQGNYSIEFESVTGMGDAYIQNTTLIYSYPPRASTLGFYGKFVQPPNFMAMWCNETTDIVFGFVGFGVSGDYISCLYSDGYYLQNDATDNLTVSFYNTWHWYEIEIFRIAPLTARYYIDGLCVDTINGNSGDTWEISSRIVTACYYTTYSHWWLDYVRINEGQEYPPYIITNETAPSNVIDLMRIPTNIAEFTGFSTSLGGIIATICLMLFAELPTLFFASDNIFIIVTVGMLVMSIGVALGWLPFITMVIPILVMGILIADIFRKWITGHTQ